jgi:acyl-CoA synthetase (AMP-forming)/AMP-acid ligase II
MHLDEILTETAQRVPHRPAVTCGERRLTYAELDAEVSRVASGFRNLGLVPGDRLAYQVGNARVESIVTLFAALRAGLVVVPLPLRQAPVQVAYVLRHSARACAGDRAPVLRASERRPAVRSRVDRLGRLRRRGDDRVRRASVRPAAAADARPAADDSIGLLLYTSGTTSAPKASRTRSVVSAIGSICGWRRWS